MVREVPDVFCLPNRMKGDRGNEHTPITGIGDCGERPALWGEMRYGDGLRGAWGLDSLSPHQRWVAQRVRVPARAESKHSLDGGRGFEALPTGKHCATRRR